LYFYPQQIFIKLAFDIGVVSMGIGLVYISLVDFQEATGELAEITLLHGKIKEQSKGIVYNPLLTTYSSSSMPSIH